MSSYEGLKALIDKAIDNANEFLDLRDKMLSLTEDDVLVVKVQGRKFLIIEDNGDLDKEKSNG